MKLTTIKSLIPAALAAFSICLGAKADTIDLSLLTANYTAQDGDVLTGETSQRVTIAADATVALAGISIKNHLGWGDSAMTCAGTATLIIADNTVNTIGGTLCAGGAGTTLTIQGNIGSLVVNGSDHSAGIGGKYNSACGDIVINGGVITVTGGSQGAGIGPGFDNNSSRDSSCGNITINGGTISVTGGDCCAGIGASNTQPCGNITINGGKVTAVAVSQAPGIGGGWYGCGNIAIAGGKVFATGKYYWYSTRNTCISGAGIGWNCSDVTIASTIEKVVASIDIGTPVKSQNGMVTIAESLKQTQEGNTLTIEPDCKYAITWLNDDGTEIDTTIVPSNVVPVHAEPTKAAAAVPYRWVFTGWTPELEAAVSNTTYAATFQKIADLALVESDWTAADGDVISGETTHKVTIPGGATVTINGVAVAGGGGAAVDAPSFSESGESAVTKFEGAGDTWTLTAFAEMEGDSVGTAVTDGQIKVYAADSVEGLKDAEPVSEGVTVTERKSAVKTTIEVVLPGTPEKQFFKVKFGE